MGSTQKKKKRTDDVRSTITDIQREQDLDVNKLALQPTFELGYSPLGVGVVDFVNVSTSLGPAQGSSGFPAQVTGLTVTPHAGSNTQLDLTWTATTLPAEFNYYNVYRGPTGFTVDPSFIIVQPVTNSYNDTGLTLGTTYYYRVSITNDALLEGAASSEISGTTTGIAPTLLLHLDGSITDSSGNSFTAFGGAQTNGYSSPGKFGTNSLLLNTPSLPTPKDRIILDPLSAALQMNTTVGFSVSLWVYPTSMTNPGSGWRVIMEADTNSSNQWTLRFDSSGNLYFFVRKAGSDIKRQVTGLVANSWQHIAAVYDAAANTVKVYRNAVEGSTTATAVQYTTFNTNLMIIGWGADGISNYYEGRIDEVQYFDGKILTPTQVTNLMNTNAT